MKSVLIDTNIWSTYLRRKSEEDADLRYNVEELIKAGRVEFIGPIRQEVLSGIKDNNKFELLKEYLSAFDDEVIHTHEYEIAAKLTNGESIRCIRPFTAYWTHIVNFATHNVSLHCCFRYITLYPIISHYNGISTKDINTFRNNWR